MMNICRLRTRIFCLTIFAIATWMIVQGAFDYDQCRKNVYSASHCGTETIISFIGTQPENDPTCDYNDNCGTYYLYELSNGCEFASLNTIQTLNTSVQYCRDGNVCYSDVSAQVSKCSSGLMEGGTILLSVAVCISIILWYINRGLENRTITVVPSAPSESNSNV
jgi:hypothetical protein